jgi:site-specific recombinase XerD
LIPVFAAAKVENGHSHRFRHTFATELLKQGVSTLMVATLFGNAEQIVIKHHIVAV